MSANGGLQEEGRKLLTAFYATLSALKLYPVENAATQQAITELHALMGAGVLRDGGVELRIVGDFFFLNETRLRLDLSNFATFGSFARNWAAISARRATQKCCWPPGRAGARVHWSGSRACSPSPSGTRRSAP